MLHAAGTLAVGLHAKLDKALVAPSGVPAVLYEPVVLTVLTAISDSKHGVVKVCTAALSQHTAAICLEDFLISLDCDSKRLGVESGLHLLGVVRSDSIIRDDSDAIAQRLIIQAGIVLVISARFVWVFVLGHGKVSSQVIVKGVSLQATHAAIVLEAVISACAVNELLLREGEELALTLLLKTLNVVGTLERSSGREGPA